MLHRAVMLALAMIVVISSQCVAACTVTESLKPPAHCHEDAKPSCNSGAEQETAAVIAVTPEMAVVLLFDVGALAAGRNCVVARVDLRPKPPLRI
jgi:hypothetical protein